MCSTLRLGEEVLGELKAYYSRLPQLVLGSNADNSSIKSLCRRKYIVVNVSEFIRFKNEYGCLKYLWGS